MSWVASSVIIMDLNVTGNYLNTDTTNKIIFVELDVFLAVHHELTIY